MISRTRILRPNELLELESLHASCGLCAVIAHAAASSTRVREGLTALRKSGCTVFVITEGARDRILRIAQDHRVVDLFDRVIEAPKSAHIYARALKLIKQPVNAFMVGDQLDRDIGPAKAAGLTTIYFAGGFRPRWEPAEAAVRPEYRIESFSEVPDIVLAECRREVPRRVAALFQLLEATPVDWSTRASCAPAHGATQCR